MVVKGRPGGGNHDHVAAPAQVRQVTARPSRAPDGRRTRHPAEQPADNQRQQAESREPEEVPQQRIRLSTRMR